MYLFSIGYFRSQTFISLDTGRKISKLAQPIFQVVTNFNAIAILVPKVG